MNYKQSLYHIAIAMYKINNLAYHNMQHVTQAQKIATYLATNEREYSIVTTSIVEMALLFHDTIYVPERNDNEINSALMARAILESLQSYQSSFVIDTLAIDKICELIILTSRHCEALNESDLSTAAKLVMDADLHSLATFDYSQYIENARKIRLENVHLDIATFCTRRKQFLETMLNKPTLFYTDFAKKTMERQARANIERELDDLDDNIFIYGN